MRRKMLMFNFVYYIAYFLIYTGFLFISTRLFRTSSLDTSMTTTYGLLYIITPILIVVLMRFSLFKWYVDPIAAAEVPLFLYVGMIFMHMSRREIGFFDAFLKVNRQLFADVGEIFFFIGLFVFGLLASFSFARKRGESISYRVISKIIS